MSRELLGIYLNDHLAGATAGRCTARHIAEHHRSSPYGEELRRVAEEVAQDRQALLNVMDELGVAARRHKVYAGWLGEKARLLKLNGLTTRRSGLSSVIELEMLRLGIEGKSLLCVRGWTSRRGGAEGLDGEGADSLRRSTRPRRRPTAHFRSPAVGGVRRHSRRR
ncbi:hypothetical protein ACGFZ9_50125 [Streptomyces mirabilis]|uniref:hypothetical protein n=1 Tax=Streptomyces mirabilis TaxID=68239 RepID=UPI003721C778